MKNLLALFSAIILWTNVFAQQLIVDNQIDCYIIIDLDENCGARSGGPYDNPANQMSYHNLSTDNINNPNDIESFSIEKQSNGDIDIVKFTTACQTPADTSPHTLDNSLIQCLSNDIVVEWQVNGGDFDIIIRY